MARPKRTEEEIDELLDEVRAAYGEEERAAVAEEVAERDERDRRSMVYSVRLPKEVYDAVRLAAERQHLVPSALIRKWIAERVADDTATGDLHDAVAMLRRDVERVERLVRPA